MKDSQKYIQNNGFIYSVLGRKRRLIKAKEQGDMGDIRSGLNFLVQSVASDVNLLGAISAHNELKTTDIEGHIFALVHDSIVAEIKEEDIPRYMDIVKRNIQKNWGVSIPGTPVGCDFEVGDDYSIGKYEKTLSEELLAEEELEDDEE